MKKLLIVFITAIVALTANAKPPQLSVEQFFDGRYNNERTVSIFISKENGAFYRMLQVHDNPGIVKKIAETLAKDKVKTTRYFEQTGEGGKSTIVKVLNNGETIDIGFQQAPIGKSATLFIKGPEKAFK